MGRPASSTTHAKDSPFTRLARGKLGQIDNKGVLGSLDTRYARRRGKLDKENWPSRGIRCCLDADRFVNTNT